MSDRVDLPGALTIDVEDYFHVHAFTGVIDRADWPGFESRVERNTHRLLDMFAEAGACATFFTLGCVAAEQPGILRRIVADGHELASHGWDHRAVHEQDRAAFVEDVRRARLTLEEIGAAPVRGYRAPSFSIDARSSWAHEALAEAGYGYSSSSNPIAHDLYGDPDAPRHPFREPSAGMLEIPVTTLLQQNERRRAAGGGGFFRLLPLKYFLRAQQRMRDEGVPPNFYLHPWEIDPGQPRIAGAPLKARFRHYVGLSRCEAKLARMLASGPWTRMDEAYRDWIEAPKQVAAA